MLFDKPIMLQEIFQPNVFYEVVLSSLKWSPKIYWLLQLSHWLEGGMVLMFYVEYDISW
jgi:hypothetical protein